MYIFAHILNIAKIAQNVDNSLKSRGGRSTGRSVRRWLSNFGAILEQFVANS